jgi:hypothetical protein
MKKSEMRSLWSKAKAAGLEAAKAVNVPDMIVAKHVNPMDDASPVEKVWQVPGGPCGFAGLKIRPGNSSFANWLKKNGYGRADSYAGGVYVGIHEHGQSLAWKEAHAYAMAEVLRAAGINAYVESRMD